MSERARAGTDYSDFKALLTRVLAVIKPLSPCAKAQATIDQESQEAQTYPFPKRYSRFLDGRLLSARATRVLTIHGPFQIRP